MSLEPLTTADLISADLISADLISVLLLCIFLLAISEEDPKGELNGCYRAETSEEDPRKEE